MQPQKNTRPPQPWYKEPWVWFILGILTCSVVLGLTLLTVAVNKSDSLVQDNYYKEGLSINRNLSRDQRAIELGLVANLTLDRLTGAIRVYIDGQLEPMPEQLKLSLLSPTVANDDQVILLRKTPGGDYIGDLLHQINGRHYVQIETTDAPTTIDERNGKHSFTGWRMDSEIVFDDRNVYRFKEETQI